MHATKTLLLLASCALCIAFAPSARADYFGLEVVERTDLTICQDPSPEIPHKLEVCEVYAVFDDPADRVISVAFTNVSTTDPAGFFQHTLGGNTAPSCSFVSQFPTLVCDSFVTLGVDCFDLIDNTTADPDFDFTKFNSTGEVSGGWFNSAPSNGQGVPDANGRVMIARFSYKQNKNTTGDVCLFTQLGGSKELTEFLLLPFDCSVPGGGLPAGDPPDACVDGTGSCFDRFGNVTPGCDCMSCCELICSMDPFCCDEDEDANWDDICAGFPNGACALCDVFGCQDCNNNDRDDVEDIACGGGNTCDTTAGSFDCNANRIPDECEIDAAQDPDKFYCISGACIAECDLCFLDQGCEPECEVVCAPDCNSNGIPDDCEPDCNENSIPDDCDIDGGTSLDINGNGIPDECEDCNGNDILDDCDLDCSALGGLCEVPGCGLSGDCDGNGNPDECDIDMDSPAPGGPFFCDLQIQTCDPDCNTTGIPDACDITSGSSQDIDSNGEPDECQEDCNYNTIFDFCDVSCGAPGGPCQVQGCGESEDCNTNDVPDECEVVLRGPIFLSGHDTDDVDHCWGTEGVCGDLYGQLLRIAVNDSQIDTGGTKKLLAIGVNGDPDSDAARALAWFNDPDNKGPNAEITIVINIGPPDPEPTIVNVDFADYSAIYIPSSKHDNFDHVDGGITNDQLAALNTRQADIEIFVNELNGGLLALTQADAPGAYGWLPVPLQTQVQLHRKACPTETLNLILDEPVSCEDISPQPDGPYHNIFTGPPGFLGLSVLAVSDDTPFGEALILGELDSVLGVDCNGDGTVGAFDLAVLLGNWGPLGVGSDVRCLDANGDGLIGAFDLAHLLGNWGPCPP